MRFVMQSALVSPLRRRGSVRGVLLPPHHRVGRDAAGGVTASRARRLPFLQHGARHRRHGAVVCRRVARGAAGSGAAQRRRREGQPAASCVRACVYDMYVCSVCVCVCLCVCV